jgi:hypothetical protein
MLNNHTLCFQFDRPYRAGGRLLRDITAVATTNNASTVTSSPIQITVTAAAAQVYYIHTDQLNTPRLITNSTNAKVWEWNNDDPFAGNAPNDDPNATGNHFTYNPRLPGQYFDSETNTNYNYFRDYDPSPRRAYLLAVRRIGLCGLPYGGLLRESALRASLKEATDAKAKATLSCSSTSCDQDSQQKMYDQAFETVIAARVGRTRLQCAACQPRKYSLNQPIVRR